ncbi:hypothetical protein HanIR_Chr11g0504831 [Helianthus annuus]|nr:hypothetical protein HanIR_Chr11g0504831 [Helianthus annuus]
MRSGTGIGYPRIHTLATTQKISHQSKMRRTCMTIPCREMHRPKISSIGKPRGAIGL